MLSPLLRFTASDYTFGILDLRLLITLLVSSNFLILRSVTFTVLNRKRGACALCTGLMGYVRGGKVNTEIQQRKTTYVLQIHKNLRRTCCILESYKPSQACTRFFNIPVYDIANICTFNKK